MAVDSCSKIELYVFELLALVGDEHRLHVLEVVDFLVHPVPSDQDLPHDLVPEKKLQKLVERRARVAEQAGETLPRLCVPLHELPKGRLPGEASPRGMPLHKILETGADVGEYVFGFRVAGLKLQVILLFGCRPSLPRDFRLEHGPGERDLILSKFGERRYSSD
jgi:hypothetical protein